MIVSLAIKSQRTSQFALTKLQVRYSIIIFNTSFRVKLPYYPSRKSEVVKSEGFCKKRGFYLTFNKQK